MNTTYEVDTSQLAEVREQTAVTVERVPAEVTTLQHYEVAASVLRDVKTRAKELDELRRSMTRPLDDAKSRIIGLFKPIQDELATAERDLKARMLDYVREQDRIAEEEQRRVEAERAAAEAAAMRAAEEGRYEEAMAAQEQRDAMPDPVPAYKARDARGYKPAAGTSTQSRWKAEITDLPSLVLAVAMGEAPLNLITPNQQALDALARATKQSGEPPPGVVFREVKAIAAAGR